MATVLNGLTFRDWSNVSLDVRAYGNGRIALQCFVTEDGFAEPLLTATVNLPNSPCGPDEVWVKDWSENEGVSDWLKEIGVIEQTPVGGVITGRVMAERYKLTAEFQQKMFQVCDEED